MNLYTIIIPTNERHDLLLRAIDYYKNFSCNILIADSSRIKINCIFPENIFYKHLPGLSFVEKIVEVAKMVTTPYLCMSGDDDYLLESGLAEGARFLENNLDFVSVQGRILSFKLIENQVLKSNELYLELYFQYGSFLNSHFSF